MTAIGNVRGGRVFRAASVVTAAVVAVAVASGTPSPAAVAATAVPSGGCPAVAAEFMAGTWETSIGADPSVSVGLLKPIADDLARRFPGKIRIRFPAYPAQAFTGGVAYGTSAAAGGTELVEDIASLAGCANTRWLLFGYSQGSEIAGDVASEIGCTSSPIPAERVLGVGLIADPKQNNTGGQVVGARVDGQGIAGTRPQGFCGLSSRVAQLCDNSDKYCSTNVNKNPLLAAVGKLVSQQPGATGSSALTDAMTSGVSGAQLAQLPGDIQAITSLTGASEPGDLSTLVDAANRTSQTLTGLGETASFVRQNPAAQTQLSSGGTGSAERTTDSFLSTLSGLDLGGAINSAASIAHTAAAIGAGGNPPAGLLSQPAQDLAAAAAPITGSPADVLSTAGQVLSILKPSVVIGQLTNAGTNALEFAGNIPQILDHLRRLGELAANPALLVPGSGQADLIRQAHRLTGELNNLFQPVVEFAAGADLHLVSGLLRLIPDPTGAALIGSMVIDLLAQADVVGLAKSVGDLQEALWHGIETGDWLAAGARAAGAGLSVVSVGLRALGSG